MMVYDYSFALDYFKLFLNYGSLRTPDQQDGWMIEELKNEWKLQTMPFCTPGVLNYLSSRAKYKAKVRRGCPSERGSSP